MSKKDAIFQLSVKYHINLLYHVTNSFDGYITTPEFEGIPPCNIDALESFTKGLLKLIDNYRNHPEKLNEEYVKMIYKISAHNRSQGMKSVWKIKRPYKSSVVFTKKSNNSQSKEIKENE